MKDSNKEKPDMLKSSSEFDYIYGEYFTPLYRYILSQVKDRQITEDLVQTVFFKVLQKFPPEKLPPLPYFFTIARNSIIDYWKKKKETILDISAIPFSSLIDESANSQKNLEKKFNLQEISQALEELSYEQKEVLTLHFISDLPNSEIAQLLEKSEEAIRQIQYRALKRLRTMIKFYE